MDFKDMFNSYNLCIKDLENNLINFVKMLYFSNKIGYNILEGCVQPFKTY